jgi:hypothetical protein
MTVDLEPNAKECMPHCDQMTKLTQFGRGLSCDANDMNFTRGLGRTQYYAPSATMTRTSHVWRLNEYSSMWNETCSGRPCGLILSPYIF